ncbi:hypothetical protein [Thalassospira xiamenensis]|uniref:Uncharacterized protein n=1 Tax=Thalassospira xiamenensis TaxID=220697 RepID=A0A285TRG9_9PROT|nr:hypothetical protein [Thalassospira xiamenensis]SOC26216.1 hypothetical protein SAMN05428964_10581 [Thalassospira xiamenensis]
MSEARKDTLLKKLRQVAPDDVRLIENGNLGLVKNVVGDWVWGSKCSNGDIVHITRLRNSDEAMNYLFAPRECDDHMALTNKACEDWSESGWLVARMDSEGSGAVYDSLRPLQEAVNTARLFLIDDVAPASVNSEGLQQILDNVKAYQEQSSVRGAFEEQGYEATYIGGAEVLWRKRLNEEDEIFVAAQPDANPLDGDAKAEVWTFERYANGGSLHVRVPLVLEKMLSVAMAVRVPAERVMAVDSLEQLLERLPDDHEFRAATPAGRLP